MPKTVTMTTSIAFGCIRLKWPTPNEKTFECEKCSENINENQRKIRETIAAATAAEVLNKFDHSIKEDNGTYMCIFPAAPTLSSHFQFGSGVTGSSSSSSNEMQLFHRLTLTSSSFIHTTCRVTHRYRVHHNNHNYNGCITSCHANEESTPRAGIVSLIFDSLSLMHSPLLRFDLTLRHFSLNYRYILFCCLFTMRFFTCTFQTKIIHT